MKFIPFYLQLAACLLICSCAEDVDEKFETEKFVRIYDFNGFSESFSPIDIQQTPDGGFIILANYQKQTETLTRGVYLLKVDKTGNFLYATFLDETYSRALKGLEQVNGNYYFFCMDESSRAVLVETDPDIQQIIFTQTSLSYPAATAYSGADGFLILSYDQVNKKTVFSKMSLTGNVTLTRKFKIADDDSMEDLIIQHFLGSGKQFPFSVGRFPGGNYYFNGFYDYTFSLVTTSLGDDDDVDHLIHGQHENGGFSAISPLNGNSFAASYFNFGTNYFVPELSLPEGPSSIGNLGGYHMRELVPDARVHIDRMSIENKPLLLYSSDAKSRQIALYFYDESSGELAGSMYLGFSNPYEVGDLVTTSDGGLAVCGTTYIAGRFPRVCLFKISKEELEGVIRR